MPLELSTLVTLGAYVIVVAGFIFRLEGRVRHLTSKLDALEERHLKFNDELIPTIHKLEAKFDVFASVFLNRKLQQESDH